METRTHIEIRLAEAGTRLTAKRRRLVEATLANPDDTFHLSARALARRYGVDPATIVRTIQALGYERYADFAADLRKHFVSRISPYRVMAANVREGRSLEDQILYGLDRDLANLNGLRAEADPRRVVDLAERIHAARRILVVGVDLAESLASFLAYGLIPLGFDAETPSGSEGSLRHRVRTLTPDDLLIAISFGRCLRVTVEAVVRAAERGVPTFGLTDSDTTPLARLCDAYLLAPISGRAFTGSYVAPMALLNGILIACAQLVPERALARLQQSEHDDGESLRWYEPESERPPERSN
jgi:RpiR family transcriptional regulator, carbohydrate utilization regulator